MVISRLGIIMVQRQLHLILRQICFSIYVRKHTSRSTYVVAHAMRLKVMLIRLGNF